MASGSGGSAGGSPGPFYGDYQHQQLQSQVDRLTASHDELSSHIRSLERNIGSLERNLSGLERNYHEVLMEMVGFQRNMAQQDSVMQGLIEWVLRGGGGAGGPGGEGKGKRRALALPTTTTLPSGSSSTAVASSSTSSSGQPGAGPSSSSAIASTSTSNSSSNSAPLSSLSSFALSNENPFVPSSVAQQIIGPWYRDAGGMGSNNGNGNADGMGPGTGRGMGMSGMVGSNDAVGRAALMKMSEISRRAGEVLTGAGGATTNGNGAGMFGDGRVGDRPPSRLWMAAANAGLINPDGSLVNSMGNTSAPAPAPASGLGDAWGNGNGNSGQEGGGGVGPTKINSRQEALAKIEELQKMRPASAGFLSNAAAKLVNAMETYGSGASAKLSKMGSLRDETPFSSMSDASSEDVVMPSVSTIAAAAAVESSEEQEQQQLPQDSQSNGAGSETWNMMLPSVPPLSSYGSQGDPSSQTQTQDQPTTQLSMLNPFQDYTSNHEGLQVYTVGHLMPKSVVDEMSGTWNFDTGMFGGGDSSGGFGFQTGEMMERAADGSSPPVPSASTSDSQVFDPSSSTSSPSSPGSGSGSKKLRVRRSTFVPGWAVSPRVLLVDDDAVSRKLSSKFLQVFGCKIDVAVDGVGAVNKMNLEKYDLVLMDIVMPKLDGVSATSMIRKFDHMTPIISMTSNSKPNDIMTYYHSGMNDILPKPFTKQGLLDMLEKHLMHLKVIQQMSRVPRSVGIPPLSDSGFEQAITSQAALLTRQNGAIGPAGGGGDMSNPSGSLALTAKSASDMSGSTSSSSYAFSPLPMMTGDDDDFGRLNPLAGMGLTDEQYNAILAGIVNGETFAGSMDMGLYGGGGDASGGGGTMGMDTRKRELDEQEDGRDGKRSRFEVI
ncbi:hypothetical protein GYMLUDRAFT_49772, partial [Collybiopsis luxurians FD-317 M1]